MASAGDIQAVVVQWISGDACGALVQVPVPVPVQVVVIVVKKCWIEARVKLVPGN